MGDQRRDAARRPDPERSRLRRGAGRVPAAAVGPGAVRQRRRQREPGLPVPGFEHSFSRFPVPGTQARSWYLGPSGRSPAARRPSAGRRRSTGARRRPCHRLLRATPAPAACGRRPRPTTGRRTRPAPRCRSCPRRCSPTRWCSAPARCRLWIKASTPRRRPAGRRSPRCAPTARRRSSRTAGCGRASASSTHARARCSSPSRRSARATSRPLPKGRFTKVTVPLYYEGHAYRAGSRIRITISAPNGTSRSGASRRPGPEGPRDGVGRRSRARALALGAAGVPGVAVPTPLPPCPGLRGEPCRTYVPASGQALGRPCPSRSEASDGRSVTSHATRPVAATAAPSTQTPVQPSLPYSGEAAADIAAPPAK